MIIGSHNTPPWLLGEGASCVLVRDLAKYTKSITVEQIAKAMIATSLNTPATSDVYHYPEMTALTEPLATIFR